MRRIGRIDPSYKKTESRAGGRVREAEAEMVGMVSISLMKQLIRRSAKGGPVACLASLQVRLPRQPMAGGISVGSMIQSITAWCARQDGGRACRCVRHSMRVCNKGCRCPTVQQISDFRRGGAMREGESASSPTRLADFDGPSD